MAKPEFSAMETDKSGSSMERAIRKWGDKIFDLMEGSPAPSLFTKKGLYHALMEWSMKDEAFKTQLFRFIDVLPSLHSSAEITRHFREYLEGEAASLSPAVGMALKASGGASWLFAAGVKQQVSKLAQQFILGSEEGEIVNKLRTLQEHGVGFTVDLLGEAVVSEAEADQYAERCMSVLNRLATETSKWSPFEAAQSHSPESDPILNLSVKISALDSQLHPADPESSLDTISKRLRPLLRRAKSVNALINFDMEHFGLKRLTLDLFKQVFSESEFNDGPHCGLALQAYLKDSESDLKDLLNWARTQRRRMTIRLVKGAYWDYEVVQARQKNWPVPVFTRKAESDANFERLSLILLENREIVSAAFGTHNVRSMAHVLAHAERLSIPAKSFEFQMLYGMADSIKRALVELGFRVREYCPVGELLPGMAYLVRRLLENTSNEGFLAKSFAAHPNRDDLLKDPNAIYRAADGPSEKNQPARDQNKPAFRPNLREEARLFRNEPPTDFTIDENRRRMREALEVAHQAAGVRYPLIIGHRAIQTKEWLPSLNPASQNEVIGYAAQAGIEEADAALQAAQSIRWNWAKTAATDRAKLLEKVADLMVRDKMALAALEVLEAGKAWSEADADVAEAIDFCRFYASEMRALAKPRRTQDTPGELNVQEWLPRGIGVVIAPWNFPLAILTGMTMGVVVTGNPAIIKPSDQTPVIAARLMTLLMEAGAPAGVVNLLTAPGSTVGSYLVAHPEVDIIAFTGSKEVGLKIWQAGGITATGQKNLKKVVCEMGGKNAMIIDADADLDEAVTGTLISAFGYQGQKCSALSRLIVDSKQYERFLERLIAATASLRIGPAEDPGNVIGPVISREAQRRILQAIESGKNEARLAWQGTVPADSCACYVPPTIFVDMPPDGQLFQQEIFGPVLSVAKVRDFDEALALANRSEFALTGGIYSRTPSHIARAKTEFVCGNLYINRPITGALVERQPFGGFKMSGGGTKAGGAEYLLNFMIPRVVTENCLRRGFVPEAEWI